MTIRKWGVRIGTLPSLKKAIKKFSGKKFIELGFYVEVEEFSEEDTKRFLRAYDRREEFIYNGQPVNAKVVQDVPHPYGSKLIGTTTKQYWMATIYGPKLRNGKPVDAD